MRSQQLIDRLSTKEPLASQIGYLRTLTNISLRENIYTRELNHIKTLAFNNDSEIKTINELKENIKKV